MSGLASLPQLFSRLNLSSSVASSTSFLTAVRHASKKAGGSSKNPIGRPRGKHRGIKKRDSTYVTQGTIIVRQLGLDFHPGLNVGLGRDRSLYAMEPGSVVMTTEKVKPDWNNENISRFYADYQDRDVPIYKTYFHVIPDPLPKKFKLVDQN